jgi:hypothetical protein
MIARDPSTQSQPAAMFFSDDVQAESSVWRGAAPSSPCHQRM